LVGVPFFSGRALQDIHPGHCPNLSGHIVPAVWWEVSTNRFVDGAHIHSGLCSHCAGDLRFLNAFLEVQHPRCSNPSHGHGNHNRIHGPLATAFAFGQGTPQERLGQGMAHTFPVLFEGLILTACSGLPMAFQGVPFIVDYFCYFFLLRVFIGMANGLVFMQALLAIGLLQRD